MTFRFTLFLVFLISHLALSEPAVAGLWRNSIEVPLGGNAFQTQGTSKEKINADGIMSWKNADTGFSVYVKSETDASISLELNILSQESSSEIKVEINGQTQAINLSAGKSGLIPVGKLKLIKGYYEIKLFGVEKSGSDFAKIKNLLLNSDEDLSLDFVKENIDNRFYWGRRGPSVHLSYTLPDDIDYKWFYNEVSVPKGS